LSSNAIKYSRPGGRIMVRLTRDHELVRWQIQDTGIGIPKESQRHLFEKFYRADNVVALETDGTGLGLYLVRLIVEQMGGRGWFVGFPLTSGPIALILALEQGVDFAAAAAAGSMAGAIAQSAFCVVYGKSARRWRWGPALVAGSLAFAAAAVGLQALTLSAVA